MHVAPAKSAARRQRYPGPFIPTGPVTEAVGVREPLPPRFAHGDRWLQLSGAHIAREEVPLGGSSVVGIWAMVVQVNIGATGANIPNGLGATAAYALG